MPHKLLHVPVTVLRAVNVLSMGASHGPSDAATAGSHLQSANRGTEKLKDVPCLDSWYVVFPRFQPRLFWFQNLGKGHTCFVHPSGMYLENIVDDQSLMSNNVC